MQNTIIITAGGAGKRMGASIPKQFLELNHRPILMHTIQKFHDFDPNLQILVTLPSVWFNTWAELCAEHNFVLKHHVLEGGIERFDSIKEALKLATGALIAVHDGVRPLVSNATIAAVFEAAQVSGAAVPVLPLTESIRHLTATNSLSVDRNAFRNVQTPQCFEANLLKRAYEKPYQSRFTDDASVVESLGINITLVASNPENIKITLPIDLKVAEMLLGC
jgi:2-C-methyl-D-erythritol 4-phosphate cytidylyltransferase